MPSIRGISISLVSQSDLLTVPEYVDPASGKVGAMQGGVANATPAGHGGNEPAVVTVYIPTYQSTISMVQYRVAGPHETESMFFFKLFVDGDHTVSWGCSNEDGFSGSVMFDLFESEANRTYYRCVKELLEMRAFFYPSAGEDAFRGGAAVMDFKTVDSHVLEIFVFRAKGRKAVDPEIQAFVQSPVRRGNHGHLGDKYHNDLGDYYKYVLVDPKDKPYATFRYLSQSWYQLEKSHLVYLHDDPSPVVEYKGPGFVQPHNGTPCIKMEDVGTSPIAQAVAYEYCKKNIAGLRGPNDPFLTEAGTPLKLSTPIVDVETQDVQVVLPADIPTATSSVYLRCAGPSPCQNHYTDGPFCLAPSLRPNPPRQNPPVADRKPETTIPTVVVTPPPVDDVPELSVELPSGGIIHPRFILLKPAPTAKEYRAAKARRAALQLLKMQLLGAGKVRRPPRSDIAGSREIFENSLPFRVYQDEYNRELMERRANKIKNISNVCTDVQSPSHVRSDSSGTETSNQSSTVTNTTMITFPDDDGDDASTVLLSDDDSSSSLTPNPTAKVTIHNTWSADADIPIDPLEDPAYLEARRAVMAHMRALAISKKNEFCRSAADADAHVDVVDGVSPRREHGRAMMSVLLRRIGRMDAPQAFV